MNRFDKENGRSSIRQYLIILPLVIIFSPINYFFNLGYSQITTIYQFGELSLLLYLLKIFIPFCSLGLGKTYTYFFPEYEPDRLDYRAGLILFSFLLLLVISTAISAGILIYGYSSASWVLISGAFSFLIFALIRVSSQLAKAIGSNYVSIINNKFSLYIAPLCMALILLIFNRHYPDWVIGLSFLMGLLIAAGIQVMLALMLLFKLDFAKPAYEIKRWFSFGAPIAYISGVNSFDKFGQVLVVEFFLGNVAVALYAAALSIMQILKIPRQVFGYIVERLINKSMNQNDASIKKRLILSYFVATFVPSTIFLVAMIAFGSGLLNLLGKQFVRGDALLNIILIAGYVGIVSDILREVMAYAGKVYRVAVLSTIVFIVSIGCSIFLVYFWGLDGVGLGFLIGRIVSLILFVIMAIFFVGDAST